MAVARITPSETTGFHTSGHEHSRYQELGLIGRAPADAPSRKMAEPMPEPDDAWRQGSAACCDTSLGLRQLLILLIFRQYSILIRRPDWNAWLPIAARRFAVIALTDNS